MRYILCMKFLITALLIQSITLFSFAEEVAHTSNLFELHFFETSTLTPEQIKELNNQTISDLESVRIDSRDQIIPNKKSRVTAITPETARVVINSIEQNPVTKFESYAQYNQPGVDLGFCFGRATFFHLLLLKMGVDKRSIKKVWQIGTMKAGPITWGYHVATAVKSTTGEWLILDSVPGKLLNIRDWVDFFAPQNVDHKDLRVYVSEPARFGTGPGIYTRASFGLDYDREQDWYRHYFLDLMHWFQKTELSSLGLSDLR